MKVYLVIDEHGDNNEPIGICTSREKAVELKREYIKWMNNEEEFNLDDYDVSIMNIPVLDEIISPYYVLRHENLKTS